MAFRFNEVLTRLRAAERAAGRLEGAVRLIAVSKTQRPEAIAELYHCGQRDFGENYLQEALSKQESLRNLNICWHFIGPIQSNKTRLLAAHFDWVHSIDRLKIAERLNDQRPEGMSPLHVCIQVNVSGEASKSGADINDLPDLAKAVAGLPNLHLRGLMTIPAPADDFEQQRAVFRTLRKALENLPIEGLDTLSMGMSNDMEAAVLEGATMVRIGTALFGERRQSPLRPADPA